MGRLNAALFSSATPEWYTPPDLLDAVRSFLGHIDLDPCAVPATVSERKVIGLAGRDNGLAVPWRGRVFCNPPYGRQIGTWIRKAMTEAVDELVLLVPSRTDTAWFQSLTKSDCTICFLRGRLRFSGAKYGAPFPSALVYRGGVMRRLQQHSRDAARWTSVGPGYALGPWGNLVPALFICTHPGKDGAE